MGEKGQLELVEIIPARKWKLENYQVAKSLRFVDLEVWDNDELLEDRTTPSVTFREEDTLPCYASCGWAPRQFRRLYVFHGNASLTWKIVNRRR